MVAVRQDQQYKEPLSTDPVDIVPYNQLSSEGQGLAGPFKVPSDVLKKQYFYGKCTSQLIIDPLTSQRIKLKMNYSSDEKNVKEKRKPTVSKNTKPKQVPVGYFIKDNNIKLH